MVFANPLFLFGLFALAIPILIHLFNFRRYRKLYFTNVRFLEAIRQETRKRSEIKQLLILLSRLLAVASLVLAFAQPYIPSPLMQRKVAGRHAVSMYIDNSFSMEAAGTDGSLLEAAKAKALDIASACQPSDQFLLVTNEAGGLLNHPVSREEFADLVRDIRLSPVSMPLSTIVLRQKEALARTNASSRTLYLISDFQRVTADLSLLPPDTVNTYVLVPLERGKRKNLTIDTAWFESPVQQPGQPSVLSVRLRNTGDETVEKVPVRLSVGGQQKAVASVALEPGARTDVALHFTNGTGGSQGGVVEIMDYPIVFDDKLFIAYEPVRTIPILAIGDGNADPFLDALFGDDSAFSIGQSAVKRLDYSSLSRYRVIILDGIADLPTGLVQELTRYTQNGGELVIFPPVTGTAGTFNAFLASLGIPALTGPDTSKQRVDWLNTESLLFSDVFEKNAAGRIVLPKNLDLPMAFSHYRFTSPPGAGEILMRMENGDPFLTAFYPGNGKTYLFTVPLDEKMSNFPRHPVFVPVMVRMALLSRTGSQLFYYTGQNTPAAVPGDTLSNRPVYKLSRPGDDFEIIPEVRNTGPSVLIYPRGQVLEAGIYTLALNDQPAGLLAFNYDRAESDPELYSSEEINIILRKDQIKYFALLKDNKTPVSKQVRELQQGTPLWKLFLLVTLLFIATEIAIIRIMR